MESFGLRKSAPRKPEAPVHPPAANDEDHMEFVHLHVISKNLQSIKSTDRFQDFLAEVDRYQFDLLLVGETWRGEHEETFLTANGHRFFLSGGSIGRHGVGIVVGRSLYQCMSNVEFHAYSDRLCSLHFSLENVSFQVFSCYMPTSWEPYHEVEQMYDLMELLLSNCERVGASAVVGGDFNAMLGDCREADDRDVLGTCGFGERNDRGWMMAHWVARTGLLVPSRLDPHVSVEDSWTCRRAMDGQLVQIDYILSTGNLALVTCRYDHSMPVGLEPFWLKPFWLKLAQGHDIRHATERPSPLFSFVRLCFIFQVLKRSSFVTCDLLRYTESAPTVLGTTL